MNHYIHDVPGRLRLKSPLIKGNKNAEHELKKALGTMVGVATVDINLITGSLLVNYNPKVLKRNDILNLLQRIGYYDATKTITNDEYIYTSALKAGQVLGKTLFRTLVGVALEDSPLSLITILL